MHSDLVRAVMLADASNYTKGRNGQKICKITPHHMAGRLTGEQCARLFQRASRNASANYCIGYDGGIVCTVEEENRAWTSSSRSNDFQAITIEVSNSSTGGDWPISEESWTSLVNLCVDICKRYGFRLEYDGTPNGSLTRHNMFANTNCPGPYLQARLPELARVVNERLDGGVTPIPSAGYLVTITADVLNVRQGPGTNYPVKTTVKKGEVYTIVAEENGWGKLKSGVGYISLNYTQKKGEASASTKQEPVQSGRKVGDVVTINGVYSSSNSTTKLTPSVKSGTITKIVNGARNPYLLNNGNLGWIGEDCIVGNAAASSAAVSSAPRTLKTGDKVVLKTSATKYYTGQKIPASVKGKTYTVAQVGTAKVKPNGILLKEILSWVNRADVE